MAVRTEPRGEDPRVEQILRDPKGYFAQARERAREDVRADLARERSRRRPA